MGFGFGLLVVFVLFPLTTILLLVWLFSRKLIVGKILAVLWIGIFSFIGIVVLINWWNEKIVLDHQDYYGSYVIKKEFFKGKQSDWQYNSFRFEITERDSIFFYVTDKQKIFQTFKGSIETSTNYNSKRLILNMEEHDHHIMSDNPTTYRNNRSFYLVFHSPRFGNVFFSKGDWEE